VSIYTRKDFPKQGSGVLSIYKQFGLFSGLRVNVPKTVVVPLWASSLASIKSNLIADMMPEWHAVDLSYSATYLGFGVGPGRDSSMWAKALDKYHKRIDLWSSTKIGLFYTARTYNTFSIPTLTFLGQLAEVPDEAFAMEASALRKLTPGPGSWNIKEDLWYLDSAFSLPIAFKSLQVVCFASKLRTAFSELSLGTGRYDVRKKASELWLLMLDSNRSRERAEWHHWYMSCYALQLDNAVAEAATLDINADRIYSQLIHDLRQEGMSKADACKKAKADLQRALHDRLLNHPSRRPNHDSRIRHKLNIWKLGIPEGHLSRQFRRNYERLSALVAPKVHAASWRAAWNGWCVDHRFRNLSGRWWTKPCVLKCSPAAEDRIEHYCRCPCVVYFAHHTLGIPAALCTLSHFLLCEPGMSNELLTLFAILVYAVYRTTNGLRDTCEVSREIVHDMLEEYSKTAAQGNNKSSAVLYQAVHGRYTARPPHLHPAPSMYPPGPIAI